MGFEPRSIYGPGASTSSEQGYWLDGDGRTQPPGPGGCPGLLVNMAADTLPATDTWLQHGPLCKSS